MFATAQALQGSGTQMVVALGAIIVLTMTDSAMLTGIGVSAMGVSRLAVSYPLGKIADQYGRRPAMVVGLIFGMTGAPIVSLAVLWSSLVLFVVGVFIFGMGIGATQQIRVAVTDMYPGRRRGEALGYLLTGSLVGTMFGPILIASSEKLSGPIGIDKLALPWLLAPALILPTLFIILAVRPDPKEIAANLGDYWPGEESPKRGSAHMSYREYIRSKPRLIASAAYVPAQGVMTMLMAATPLVLKEFGFSLTMVSIAVTLHVLGMFAFSIPLGKMADRLGRTKLILGGLIVSALGSILVPVTDIYGFISLGIFLVGVGWSAVFVAATAIIADTTSANQRGRAVGVNDSFAAMFSIALPLIGGGIAEAFGLTAVGLLGLVMALAPLPLLFGLHEHAPGKFDNPTEPVEAQIS
jgi:MFS family permease